MGPAAISVGSDWCSEPEVTLIVHGSFGFSRVAAFCRVHSVVSVVLPSFASLHGNMPDLVSLT